jgi:hypothetical protein
VFGFTAGGVAVGQHDPAPAEYDRAWVNHYHTRSREEYLAKARRGWPDNTPEKNTEWERRFAAADRDDVADATLAPLATEVRGRMQRMAAPPARGFSAGLAPGWLATRSPTLLWHAAVRRLPDGRIGVRGFIVDLGQPGRKVMLHQQMCNGPSPVLAANRIADGAYGFDAVVEGAECLYLLTDGFAACLHADPGAAVASP